MSINAQDQRGSKRSARTLGDLGERPKETRRLLCQCGCGARARGASFSMRLARLLTGGREDVRLQGSVNTRSCPSATMDSLRTISIRFALTVARSIAFRTSSSVGGSLRHRNVNRECSCPPLWRAPRGKKEQGPSPRVRGSHVSKRTLALMPRGPSPRVRGSRLRLQEAKCLLGSIPARAGQPSMIHSHRARIRVHPRACGAAPWMVWSTRPDKGPSPRVRGSHERRRRRPDQRRSIPARAGQPA